MSTTLPSLWSRLRATPLTELVRHGATGSLDWRHAVAKVGLPVNVVETISGVVRQAWLTRREEREVADELVAHFADALAAGQSAEQALELFGDTETAAKLIARSKRRCRPLWLKLFLWGATAFAAMLLAYLAFGIYLMMLRPNIATDYVALVNAVSNNAAEDSRAWPAYEQLLLQIEKEFDESWEANFLNVHGRVSVLERLSANLLDDEDGQPATGVTGRFRSWRATHADWLNDLRSAARGAFGVGIGSDFTAVQRRLFGYWPQQTEANRQRDSWDGAIMRSLIPHQHLRYVSFLFRADGRMAAEEGNGDRVFANAVGMLDVARQASEPAHVICLLIADRIRQEANDYITEIVREKSELWSDAHLRDLAHAIARPHRPAEYYLRGEQLAVLDATQRLYSENGAPAFNGWIGFFCEMGEGDLAILDMGYERRLWLQAIRAAVYPLIYTHAAPRDEVLREAERLLAVAIEAATTPLWENPPNLYEVKDQLDAERYMALHLVSPSYEHAIQVHRRRRARTDGLLIGIALELFRRDEGDWPESLDTLTPRWIPELPVDPINGGALGYRLVDGKPVVYSLGIDGDDDLGRLPAMMDDEAQAKMGQGSLDADRPGPPLSEPLRSKKLAANPSYYDGDWVLWSLAEPQYMPETRGKSRR